MEWKFIFGTLTTQYETDKGQLKYMQYSMNSAHELCVCVCVLQGGGIIWSSLFRMTTAVGTNDFLYPFFLASGTLRLLPDGDENSIWEKYQL